MVHHIIQKPTNKIEKLYIKNSILFIEGLAYVAGHNAPQFSDLSKHLRLLNTQTQATFEYELGSIRRNELKAQVYQGNTYDYTAAGTATKGLNGIVLAELENGIYEIGISVSTNANDARQYQDLQLDFAQLNQYGADNACLYHLFQNKGKSYLLKRDIFGQKAPADSHIALTSQWVKDKIVHVEGEFIVPHANVTQFNQAKYFLIAQKPITQRQYVFELGQVKKANMAHKISKTSGYDACYFATLGLQGVDTAHFELGNYDLYVSLAYQNEVFTAQLNANLLIDTSAQRHLTIINPVMR